MIHNILPGMIGQVGAVSGACPYTIYSVEQQIGTYSSTSGVKPFYGLYNYSINGNLYSSGSFANDECQITGVQVNVQSFTTPYTVNNQEIWIGEVSNSTFPSTTPQVDFSDLTFISPLTCVKSGFTWTISDNGIWYTFNFDTPYCYTGGTGNNLLFVWKNYDGSWQSGYGTADVANVGSKSMYKGQDLSFPTGTGTRDNWPLLVKFNTKINDIYGMADQVYSLRKVVPTYTGSCITVRRSSDNSTQDIGFDVNGDLDTYSLVTFVGVGNNGYVTTWYDQSGNGRHRIQNTTAYQPRIVNAGWVELSNGKPAIYFDGVNDAFGTISHTWTEPYTIFTVAGLDPTYNTGSEYNIVGGSSTYLAKIGVKSNQWHMNNSSSVTGLSASGATSGQTLYSVLFQTTDKIRINGTEVASGSAGTPSSSTYSYLGRGNSASTYWFGHIQEFIYFGQDMTSNFNKIDNLIKTYYGI